MPSVTIPDARSMEKKSSLICEDDSQQGTGHQSGWRERRTVLQHETLHLVRQGGEGDLRTDRFAQLQGAAVIKSAVARVELQTRGRTDGHHGAACAEAGMFWSTRTCSKASSGGRVRTNLMICWSTVARAWPLTPPCCVHRDCTPQRRADTLGGRKSKKRTFLGPRGKVAICGRCSESWQSWVRRDQKVCE